MSLRKERSITKEIQIDSFMSALPDTIEANNIQVMEQLFELILLLKKYYHLKEVKGKFDTLKPDYVKVSLFNGSYGQSEPLVDVENISPIEFLRSLGGVVSKETYMYNFWCNSIITLDRSNLSNVIERLKINIAFMEHKPKNIPVC